MKTLENNKELRPGPRRGRPLSPIGDLRQDVSHGAMATLRADPRRAEERKDLPRWAERIRLCSCNITKSFPTKTWDFWG